MNDTDNNQENNKEQKFDWQSLLRRKDRPLPKAGCSWAFYLALLAILAYLIIMFLKYKTII